MGALYCPLVFLGLFGGTLGLLVLYVERNVVRLLPCPQALAQVIGLGLIMGLLYFLIVTADFLGFVSRLR